MNMFQETTRPRPANIIPVIFVSGSNYEMGYQYGYQMAESIKLIRDHQVGGLMRRLGNNINAWYHLLKGFQYYIKQYTPEIIDEMIGIALGTRDAGYEVSYADILGINVAVCMKSASSPAASLPSPLDELPPKEYREKYNLKATESVGAAQAGESPPEGLKKMEDVAGACSRWAAWGSATKDGTLVCGDSIDGFYGYQVNIIAFPDIGNAFIAGVHRCGELVLHPIMNNKGLWISGGNIDTPRDIDRNYGIPVTLALRHLGQFYENAEEARKKLLSFQTTGGRVHNAMIADTQGNAFIFELTAVLKSYRKPGDFFEIDWIASPNTYLIPENCKLFAPELRPFQTDPRVAQLWAFFDKYKGKIDVEFGKMLYRYYDPVEDTYYIGNRFNQRVNVGLPKNRNGGIFYQSTGPAGRGVACGKSPQDHLDGTHTFYTLKLEANPRDVLQESEFTVADCMGTADYALRKLSLKMQDLPAFLVLKDMFSKATDEFYKGKHYLVDAQLARRLEQTVLYGKALTSYVQAESKFKQISHYIQPPAERPEDLGLAPIEPPRPAMKVYQQMNIRQILEEGM